MSPFRENDPRFAPSPLRYIVIAGFLFTALVFAFIAAVNAFICLSGGMYAAPCPPGTRSSVDGYANGAPVHLCVAE